MANSLDESNPFSTRFTRPGAIPFQFASGESREAIVDRLAAAGWMGQMVGPHGSGKSTLLEALIPEIERRGRRVTLIVLHDGERHFPWSRLEGVSLDAQRQLIVDGCEQLSWLERLRLRRLARRSTAGLLVTTHADLGLPTVAETRVDLALAEGLVRRLADGTMHVVSSDDVRVAFEQSRGNLREMFFLLYDRFEAARAATATATPRAARDD